MSQALRTFNSSVQPEIRSLAQIVKELTETSQAFRLTGNEVMSKHLDYWARSLNKTATTLSIETRALINVLDPQFARDLSENGRQ